MFVRDHGFYQLQDFIKLKQEDEARRRVKQEGGSSDAEMETAEAE